MRKMGLWHFCFGSGLDTASLALPLSWGGCGASLPWVFEGVRLGTHSYLPGRVSLAIFALGQVYCQIYKASDSPFLPPLSPVCWAQKLFFLCLICFFHHPPALQLCLMFPGMLVEMPVFTVVWWSTLLLFSVLRMCVSCWKASDRAGSGLPHAL